MYDPSRVRYPLKRAGKRGEGKWQRSLGRGVTDIADRVIDVAAKEGPAPLLGSGGGQHEAAATAVG